MIDSVCGLCIFPDMFCVCACRPSTFPPCLSPAPVQTCLPPACPWRVHCPASKLSVSRHMQLFQESKDKRRWTAERQLECQIAKVWSREKRETLVFKKGNHSKRRIQLKEYNLTHACSFGHTDTHANIHSNMFTHSHVKHKKHI